MARGSDIALRSADMVLVRDDLRVVPDAILLTVGLLADAGLTRRQLSG